MMPTEDQVHYMVELLRAAKCPDPKCSDGSIVCTGPDPQNDACEWCYQRHQTIEAFGARASERHQSGQQRIRIETTVGGHLAVTLLPSGASALFRSTGEIGETIAHSLPNRFEAPIGECHQVNRKPTEGWLDAFDRWLEQYDPEAFAALRGPGLTPRHVDGLRSAFSAGSEFVACNKQEAP